MEAHPTPRSDNILRLPYKSRPERDIAYMLDRHRIPFIYEKPIAVVDDGKTRLWYADFALRTGLLIEYFGVNGDPGYADRTRHKLKVYEQNQYDVLALYPPDMCGAWQNTLLDRIGMTLESRAQEYRHRISANNRNALFR